MGLSEYLNQKSIMPENQIPGVYIEETPSFPPSVVQVETAIPAFIGFTQKAAFRRVNDLHLIPKKVTSMLEYERHFGFPDPEQNSLTVTFSNSVPDVKASVDESKRSRFLMYYSLQMYFANGGAACYIISVSNYLPTTGAINFGQLAQGLHEAAKIKEVKLLLFPDAINLSTSREYYDLHLAALNQCATLHDRFVVMDVYPVLENQRNWHLNIKQLRENIPVCGDLKYAAVYFPRIYSTLDYNYKKTDNTTDNDAAISVSGLPNIRTLQDLKIANNVKYQQAKSALTALSMLLPASPAIAGIYARIDSERGVWKAPANVNINMVTGPEYNITDSEQQSLNVDVTSGKSINVIRSFQGRGPAIVWGARTLAGNDNEWRYVSVRRFFNMVEESVKTAAEQFIFEPNDANTWVRVKAMIENFLILQWRAGALMGSQPDHAFYVHVGLGQTMTSVDVLEGRMIIEIGLAAVRPAEFIVIRFSQKMLAES